jgi:AmmeMemoRadiSam system protein B
MRASVREPAVAGSFYPAARAELRSVVERLLSLARVARERTGTSSDAARPKALIVPHAGYVYSGVSAAAAFALLACPGPTIRRVVIVGPAHYAFVEGLAWPGTDRVRTPLGEIAVDMAALELVPAVAADVRAHAREHSVEVELPFLQVVAPHAKVVPLVVGRAAPETVAAVLEALWSGPETVVVVSSDLSHYLPYDVGRALDERTCARIVALDATLTGDEACGAAGINGLLALARTRRLRPELVDRRSSGDASTEPDRLRRGNDEVVGYGAFAFYEHLPHES